MGQENTGIGGVGSEADPSTWQKPAGDTITADTFQQMLTVLESLATHNHIFYDDYTTVCDCQCQCDCHRGTL